MSEIVCVCVCTVHYYILLFVCRMVQVFTQHAVWLPCWQRLSEHYRWDNVDIYTHTHTHTIFLVRLDTLS